MEFNSSDALFIQAVHTCGRNKGADLESLVSYIDYLNHAILTIGEYNSSLHKFLSIGLIEEEKDKLKTTKPFDTWWDKKFSKVKNVNTNKEFEAIKIYLKETFESHALPPQTIQMDEIKFENAVAAYLKQS